jgi:chromosomal replication initiation ATPase DnaA
MTALKKIMIAQANHEFVTSGPMCSSVLSDPQNIEAAQWNGALTKRERIRRVIGRIAQEHGSTLDEVLSHSRVKHVVRARHLAMRAIIEANPELSFPHIGRLFNRDHSTVMSAIGKMGMKPRTEGKDEYAKYKKVGQPVTEADNEAT